MYLCIHQGKMWVSSGDPKALAASGLDHFEPIEYEPAAERAVALRELRKRQVAEYRGPIKYATKQDAITAAVAEILSQIED